MRNRNDGFLRWLCLSAFITFCTAPAVSAQTTWQAIGPKPIAGVQGVFSAGNPLGPTFDAAGRVTAIVPDPTYAGRIFVGTANGGLWVIDNAEGTSGIGVESPARAQMTPAPGWSGGPAAAMPLAWFCAYAVSRSCRG